MNATLRMRMCGNCGRWSPRNSMWKAIHLRRFWSWFWRPAGAGHARTRPSRCTHFDHGWDVARHRDLLKESIQALQSAGMRVSLFTGTEEADIEAAAAIGTDRIELYTEPYAREYAQGRPSCGAFARAATCPRLRIGGQCGPRPRREQPAAFCGQRALFARGQHRTCAHFRSPVCRFGTNGEDLLGLLGHPRP